MNSMFQYRKNRFPIFQAYLTGGATSRHISTVYGSFNDEHLQLVNLSIIREYIFSWRHASSRYAPIK